MAARAPLLLLRGSGRTGREPLGDCNGHEAVVSPAGVRVIAKDGAEGHGRGIGARVLASAVQ